MPIPPIKSEAIVLLIGPNIETREKEAYRLISEGYSDYLIIPAYGKILRASDNGVLSLIKQNPFTQNSSTRKNKDKLSHRSYENTHLEILDAKRVMEDYSFTSAIFVSHSYNYEYEKNQIDCWKGV